MVLFCEAKLFFGIFLCCCFPFSFFCPWQEKVQRPKGHYWCDLSDSGLSKADLLNITDCSTSHLGREVRFWVWGVGDFLLMLVLVGGWFWAEFPGAWRSKGGVGSYEGAHNGFPRLGDYPMVNLYGCRSIIMIFTRYRRCPITSLRKKQLGWIDSDIFFACLREKTNTDDTDAFTCAQN